MLNHKYFYKIFLFIILTSMDISEANKLEGKSSQSQLNISEAVEDFPKNNLTNESASILLDVLVSNNTNALNLSQNISKNLMKQSNDETSITLKTNHSEIPIVSNVLKHDQTPSKNSENVKVSSFLNSDNYFKCEQYELNNKASEKQSEAIVKIAKPLCADYKSDSDSDCESLDSESDSSTLSTYSTIETSSDSEDNSDGSDESSTGIKATTKLHEKKSKEDSTLLNLPPIEDLRISVPEDACVDIGSITNIVDLLVVVESYKGTAALDLDTVLFLDHGKRTLGKVFDILGPVTEPIYTIRFNSQEQIKSWNIKKGLKVYFAPKTEHTNFVFMTEVLKNRGTDASWKDNTEAPPEFQDFSDDDEEQLYKSRQTKDSIGLTSDSKEQIKSRKRSFSKVKQTSRVLQSNRVRNSNCSQRILNFQRDSSSSLRANDSSFTQAAPFPYTSSLYPSHMHFFPRFSGPPFPFFVTRPFINQNQNFHRASYQQRTHTFHQAFGPWRRSTFRPLFPTGPPLLPPPPPPPPPPVPVEENDRQLAS